VHGAGLLAAITPSDDLYCYHFDGIGNTVAVTDSSESVVNSYDYSPFGMIISQSEGFAQPFKHVGRLGVMAEANCFYYMRARYYDPVNGRFISEDPMGFNGGDVNLYVYVQNNPLLVVDPSGLWAGGISLDISTINPFTSSGGGTYGVNIEYTSSGGLHVYGYNTPNEQGSAGLDIGWSLTANIATGNGEWTGDFDSYNGAYGPVTGGVFHTPLDSDDVGYFGIQAGYTQGTPGIGYTRTNYKKWF